MVLLMVNFNGKMHFQNWKSVKIPLTQTINWKKNNEHHLSIILSVWKLMAIKTSH